jgi:secretion/DNA translocation related CpaE-like protein
MTTAPALLLTRDGGLADDVLRLAAAAGADLAVHPDPAHALPRWDRPLLVLVGADVADDLAGLRPPPHPELYVVAGRPVPDALFRGALTIGARAVVELPAAGEWLVELLTDVPDGTSGTARLLGVVGGSGGAGASTLAAAVALSAAAHGDALLLDLDPCGPGLDQLVGIEERAGTRWDGLRAGGRLGSRSLREALPQRDDLAVLTWSGTDVAEPEEQAVREVLSAALRGNVVVVADLPRSLAGVAGEVAGRCDEVLLVVDPGVPGVASAARVAGRLDRLGARVGVVVRSAGAALGPEAVAGALGLPLRTSYPSRRRVAEQVDLGLGPLGSRRSPLARAAREVLA